MKDESTWVKTGKLKTERMISLYSGKRYLLSFDSALRAGTVTPWAVKKTQEYRANTMAVKSQRRLRNKTSTRFQEKPQWVLQDVKGVRNPGMLAKQGTGYSGSFIRSMGGHRGLRQCAEIEVSYRDL